MPRNFFFMKFVQAATWWATLFALAGGSALTAADGKLDFGRDIRPLLADNCFRCHGPDEKQRQAGLRLDIRDEAVKKLESGLAAIVPGDSANSSLVARIMSADESERMPPVDANKMLTAEQKEVLKRWVQEGAAYAQHWSFVPPQKGALPAVSDTAWVRNEIDRFVLARLDAEKLTHAPAADRRMLIRRLSLDLTGLPPSVDEVEAFVNDTQPKAVERLVDRLLKSPHFGERMALDWLDAARYADTNGFSIDGGRNMWLWRDWVIQAFNSNLPYDQFLLQQIAGDMLPNPTSAMLIATGFQRNNMVTHEGGTIPEENLTNYNVDRVKTLGEAVLGLTLGCAQCHDHKYDPITQRDYYQLFAYFNTVSDVGLDGNGGKNPRPELQARTVLMTDEQPRVEAELARLKDQLARPDPKAVAAWVKEQNHERAERGKGLELQPLEVLKVSTPNRGAGWEVENGRYVHITQASDLVAYDVSLKLPTTSAPITGIRVVFHPDDAAPGGGWGFGPTEGSARRQAKTADKKPEFKGNFVLTAFSASADEVPGDQVNLNELLPVRRVTANSWQDAYPPEKCLDPRNDNGWSPAADQDGNVHLTATFDQPIDATKTPYATVQVNFGNGHSQVAARFEMFAVTGNDDGSPLPEAIIAIVEKKNSERAAEENERLSEYYSKHAEPTKRLRTNIANLEERLAVLTHEFPTMVMDVAAKPRDTFILHRGDYSQPTDKVEPGLPGFLPGLSEGEATNRLALARWIVMRENPLTARVAVNRIWQMLFGVGLVKTTADFGTQGEYPTHPELLDWLAVDFLDSGWDVKALVRKIVMSATYQQSSAATTELLASDPANRLLARGPRFRLPAELIRDSALKTSGLFVPRIGGPSVNPYTPGDLWREISHYGSTPATAQTFVQDHGEKLYRRSLYTFWKRTAPPPNMTVFDAPNRETCVVARPATTTPLQALVLLNDAQFVEAARAFAERALHREGSDGDRLGWAFEEATSRAPSENELRVLTSALSRERKRYTDNDKLARDYLSAGESPRDQRLSVAEHAAWAQVAALLLNLSETVTRN
ncbi:MAG TPA: PSD1 and planctomycete cytochrome C domain-containing protein [Pirellulaceae bacterium]|jgi:mono/diheme cytochrome c family protein